MKTGNIILALPKIEDAKRIGDILSRHGLTPATLCTTGAQVLTNVHRLDSGVVICGSRLTDMHYTQLAEYLPDYFELILLASAATLESCPPSVMALALPLKVNDLVGTVEMVLGQQMRRLKKSKAGPKKRSEQEQNYINNAKWVLMERNHMSEQEAFRYIQKCSMDSGTNMVETAKMILVMFCDGW